MAKTAAFRQRTNVLSQNRPNWKEGIARPLWQNCQLVESRLNAAHQAPDPQTRSQRFNDLLKHPDLLRFVREDLGVVGGTFGVADAESNEFVLLQSAKYSRNPSIPVISIPFDLGTPQEQLMLEYMFLARRQSQKLDEMAPEFYNWLFLLPEERARNWSLPASRIEEKLVSTLDFNLGLCPSGEMLFCLYAWRWLARFLQTQPEADPIITPEWGFGATKDSSMWEESIWMQDKESPEGDWMFRVSEDKTTPSEILDSWRGTTATFDSCPIECDRVVFEWRNLGLIRQNKQNAGLFDLTRAFGTLLALALKFQGTLASDQKRRSTELDDLRQRVRPKRAFSLEEITGIDRKLRTLIYQYLLLLEQKDRGLPKVAVHGARTLLRLLHRHSRFPLVPYYYTTCIRRQPVEHLIFPVLKSAVEPLTVQTVRGKEKTDAVVFCILLLNPDWTTKALPARGRKPRVAERSSIDFCHASFIARIHYFFQFVSRPIIDLGYYGGVVRKRDRKSASLAEQEFFAHRFWAYVNNIGNSLFKEGLFTRMSPQARSSFVLLSAGIDRYRGKEHDDTIQFILNNDPVEQVRQCVLIAAAWAYERAQVIPKSDSKEAVISARRVYKTARSLATASANGNSAPEGLLKYVACRISDIPAEGHPNVFTESFVVMLTSILGQALYHAFRYKVLSGNDTASVDLSFTIDLDRCSLAVDASNSGEENTKISRDCNEFKKLGTHFGTDDNVFGPTYTGDNRWSTGFSLPLKY